MTGNTISTGTFLSPWEHLQRDIRILAERLLATVYAKPAGRGEVDTWITDFSRHTWILFRWDAARHFAAAGFGPLRGTSPWKERIQGFSSCGDRAPYLSFDGPDAVLTRSKCPFFSPPGGGGRYWPQTPDRQRNVELTSAGKTDRRMRE